MNKFNNIERKLEAFIKKYYTNELLKGAILFFAFGALYFLITLLVEYFFWLRPAARTVLFWVFVLVELGLLVKFIAIPLARLFKLSKGISSNDAAHMIGEHFPEVSDKLTNTLQLHREAGDSELMLASVAQKSASLEPIPFKLAIDFKKNAKYLKYALIPIALFLIANYGGNEAVFSSSYKRVVNFSEAYEPPAPFDFYVVNEKLTGIENKDYRLQIRTTGDVIPEEASVYFNNESYFLQQTKPGEFSFVFEQPVADIEFYLQANKVTSKKYTLEVLKVPSLVNFSMQLVYPSYTGKRDEVVKSTGNAIIPEGTKVTWFLDTKQTDEVHMILEDTVYAFAKANKASFKLAKRMYSNTPYEISTSNESLKNYENIAYSLQVIKDEYPVLDLESKKDTLNEQQVYFYGKVSDDYGLSKLRLVYYEDEVNEKQFKEISIKKGNVDQFVYAFPDALDLEEGKTYEYYFEVFDNDQLHNYKSTKSTVFSFAKLTQSELEKEQLNQQKESIKNLDKALDKIEDQERELQELSRTQKEKEQLNYNDQQKLKDFLKRQEQQEEMMQDFSKQLKENLEEFQKDEPQSDEDKERLKERLERLEKKAKENEKLLEELEKLREKLDKEELTEKLEKLEKQNKNNKRNLEQMLELTKRYYVEKKAEKITRDLEKLAEKQEKQSQKEGEENTKEDQDKLNEGFKKLEEDIKELEKENNKLKKPMDIPADPKKQEEIKEEQKGASEELQEQEQQEQSGEKKDTSGAQKKQKKAAQKMKQMSKAMQMSMQMSGKEAMAEDADMLRQILDNLLVFSLEEEDLMLDFRRISDKNPLYAQKLRRQNVLKENFEHVDDSLYALSLRVPDLDETINESLVDIEYNLDRALERFEQGSNVQGVSSQQYVITGANELADMLSKSLDQMQSAMSGEGQGEGQGMGKGQGSGKGEQLPDIIQSQEELNKKMGEGKSKGEDGKGEDGEEGEGNGGEKGENGEGSEGGQNGEGEGEGGEGSGGKGSNGKDKGEGNGNGGEENGEGKGNGEQGDEYEQGLLFEIYKEQQRLRKQLEDAIQREGLGDKGDALVQEMKDVEQQLLDKGFSGETMERMSQLKHELLKLKEAAFQQGQEEKREGITNLKTFRNPINAPIEKAKKYFSNTEILNRSTLPLKGKYKKKVQEYFQGKDD